MGLDGGDPVAVGQAVARDVGVQEGGDDQDKVRVFEEEYAKIDEIVILLNLLMTMRVWRCSSV